MTNEKKFTLWWRMQIEVNTDPQRRCYSGCHAKSEMRWTAWGDLYDLSSLEDALDSAATYKKINPTREYKVIPIGADPSTTPSL